MSERMVDLVFEGGGVKGIGLAGAYSELCRQGYRPACVAGTSAGAITAALVAAGYSGDELTDLVEHDMHFPSFEDRTRLHLLGPVGEGIDILEHKGLHSGDYFLQWITERLEVKGITHFAQLRDRADGTQGSAREYRLRVIASDLTDHSMLVLPQDATRLGIEPDELSIALAVRMSMSIPMFFDPVMRTNPNDGRKHMIVDGGMLSNYPIWLFDTPQGVKPRFPTFGMLLVAPNQEDPLLAQPPAATPHRDGTLSVIGYVKAIADTMMQAHDRFYVEQANYARTIPIGTCGVGTTQFGITPEQTRELLESGRSAAHEFLETWDFDAYIAKFREGAPPARRKGILA